MNPNDMQYFNSTEPNSVELPATVTAVDMYKDMNDRPVVQLTVKTQDGKIYPAKFHPVSEAAEAFFYKHMRKLGLSCRTIKEFVDEKNDLIGLDIIICIKDSGFKEPDVYIQGLAPESIPDDGYLELY